MSQLSPPPWLQEEFNYDWRQWLNQIYNCVRSNPRETKATTSGSVVDFAIPPGFDNIDIYLDAVDLSNTDRVHVQLGTGGVAIVTGYLSYSCLVTPPSTVQSYAPTSGFGIQAQSSVGLRYGLIQLKRMEGNVWACSGNTSIFITPTTIATTATSGHIDVGGPVDLVTLTVGVPGASFFDGGSATVRYY